MVPNWGLLLNVTFKPGFIENHVVYLDGRDSASGNNTDWQALGICVVGSASYCPGLTRTPNGWHGLAYAPPVVCAANQTTWSPAKPRHCRLATVPMRQFRSETAGWIGEGNT